MILLRCSSLLLLLLAANLAYSANHSTNTITSILQSYANAFTTHGPKIDNRPVKSIYHPVPSNYVRLTTIRPDEQRLVEVTAQPSIEVGPSNFVEKYVDAHRADSSSEESDENGDPQGPPDHVIPHSEHENPREPPTRPNYTAPGNWAKPPPDKNIPLEFVPTKLYAQVRGTHTVAHLPREEAVNSAQTDEEKENAARLKEVVKISKANTVYTEEGYEDAAYDHAGQIRDADFHEGFARKLNEEHDREKGYAGNGARRRKKSGKKHNKKPKKSKALQLDNFDDDYRDHLEVIEEARTNKQRIRPDDLKVLKAALQESVVNPKNVVEDGILRLEEDLRKEAYEAQRTSTEPYATTTTTTSPPVEVASPSNEIQQETTTTRHDIFTVRPRRITTAAKPKTYLAKVKIPSQYYSATKTNVYANNGELSTEDYSSIAPYSVSDQSQNPAVGYQPIYSESQTVSPLITNPLALATVNGHGPYLFLVTSSPNPFTSMPLEDQELTTSTTQYIETPVDNTTSTGLANTYIEHSPFLVTDRKSEITSSEKHSPQYTHNNQQFYVEERPTDSHFKPPKKYKTLPNHEKMLDYLRNEKNGYLDYYTALQPPKPNPALITYSDYSREPYGNVLNQWSVSQESVRPIESAYSVLPKASRPQIDAELKRASQPVTRLLPPAPLSASEYASFRLQNTRAESTTPSIMAIMPIIQAIHKYETNKQEAFPFLLRKKRSALGPSREWEIMQRDLRLQREAEQQQKLQSKLANAGSAINEKKVSNKKFPAKFEHLLHQSPRIAEDVVNKEILKRFRKSSEESSNEASKESTIEGLDEESKEELNESSKEHGSVEVEVPELDFSDIYKADEPEPTTKKPSIDVKKYPFYKSGEEVGNTALKYIVNPFNVPQKTLGGMEFYESRNLECEEIDPNLEKIVPEEENLANKRGPRKNKPRLHGLGDKLDCYKAKYFDENPLDNPIFFEKQIETPSPPKELDAIKFASRILELPPEKDEYVIQQGPKYPEQFRPIQKKVKQRNIPKHHFSEQNMNYNYAPRWQNSAYMKGYHQRHQEPPKVMFTNESKIRSNKTRSRTGTKGTKNSNLRITPPYQRQVYEDVMGTIMNLENMYKSPGLKRSALPSFSKFYNRENDKNEENREFSRQKKRKPAEIEGLIPPPLVDPTLQKSNKYNYSKQRIRNNYNDGSLQRFKRSVDAGDKNKHFFNQTNTNSINNNTNELKKKHPFRIILTTPAPEQLRPSRQTVTIIKDEPTTTTERIIYTINDRIRHSSRNRDDLGRYNKFENEENATSSIDIRRKEPRYNNSYKRNSIGVPSSNLTSNNSVNESPKVTPLPPLDSAFSASTLIPVIVKPDENFTAGVPQESKATYKKQKPEDKIEEEPELETFESKENSEIKNKEPPKNSKEQYSVHENIKDDKKIEKTTEISDDGDKIEIITKYSSLPDSKEHKELFEFLKGEPPGYEKAFPPDESPEHLESKKEELVRIAHSKEDDPNDEEIEELDENENENENENEKENEKENEEHVGESTSENPEIESNENTEPAAEEEDNPNKNSRESDNEPFVRYSSRPYSPPENYEDELYADLGPRVNKPYFYHPPFEVPEYEKHTLGKTIDRADNDDWEHEETEDHERYIFPWEADEEEKNESDESQNYSRYEYPWEKRERKERERRRKEKLRKLHQKMYGHEEESGPEEEESVTRLVYVPLRKKHLRYYSYIVPRGKKDIKPVKRSSEQRPVTKFSSRYKSGVLKVPLENEEMLITVANNDAIKQSIMNYLQKAVSTTPKSKIVHGSSKNVTGAANTVNTVTFTSNKTTRSKIENTILKPPVNFTNPNIEKNSTVAPVSTTTSTPRQPRMRSRKAKVTVGSETVINLQTSTTPAPRVVRRRGRGRGITTSSTAAPTTTASAKPNRRRSRLSAISSTTSTTVSSTSKTLNDRRRRPSRSQLHAERIQKVPEIKKNDQSSSTTSSAPASTGRTIEHHSRVSKEEIITKTITNEDDSDEDDITDEDVSKSDSTKLASEKAPTLYSKVTRRNKPKNDTAEHTVKEKVEKVTITMEETPNHVFKTEEIDKDGVKGKFVTITANNNTNPSRDLNNNFRVKDDNDMEDMKKRMKDFNSFESVIQDSGEPSDDSSSNQQAENYLVGNLLQKSPVPIDRKSNGKEAESSVEDDSSEDEDEDDSNDDDDENDDDVDDNDQNEDEENNNNEGDKTDGLDKKNIEENKKETDNKEQKPPVLIIKDPDSRRYFYVEQR